MSAARLMSSSGVSKARRELIRSRHSWPRVELGTKDSMGLSVLDMGWSLPVGCGVRVEDSANLAGLSTVKW